MGYKEETVNRNYIYKGKILNLRCDDAVLPDGKPCKREVVEHSGGASVLCVREGKVVLVRQYRYAYGEELLEIPAGKINEGEDPSVSAARELKEETGLTARELRPLYTLYPTPGYTNEKIYIFEALGTEEGEQKLDEGEFLDVVLMPVQNALGLIAQGKIRDAKTIVALLTYANGR